jgi:hypothetical protein
MLHFMSMSVFAGQNYDRIFIIEFNFDGPLELFWGQIEPIFGA